jgi:hypothetical protein
MYRWLWVWFMFSYGGVAEEVGPPSFEYKADLTLSWLNGGGKLDLSNQNRMLGLSHAGIDLSWVRYHRSRLYVALRPDALLMDRKDPEGRVFEFERRAGSVYQNSLPIEFLDTYQLQFDFSDAFSIGVGVYPDFYSRLDAYTSPLEFGLLSKFPAKISAIQLTGAKRGFPLARPSAPAGEEKSLDFSLYAFNGSKDRVEKLAYSNRSFDYGPEARQSRKGVAASMTSYFHPQWTAFVLGGSFDCKEKQDRVQTSNFAEASIQYRSHFYLPLLASVDLRWAQDKWLSDINIPLTNQESISWKLQLEKDASTSFLLGAYLGRSERIQKLTSRYTKDLYEGGQLEAGLRRQLRGFLFGNLMVSYEKRMQRDDEGWQDGFSTRGNSYTRPSIYRIAVELACLLGSS